MKNLSATLDIGGLVFTALFSALIAVGSYLIIPLPGSPVPIALQSFFMLLAGLVLGPRRAAGSVAVFLLVGTLGLPVFAGGKGGIVHFVGPTGGYLLGYLPAAFLTGLIAGRAGSRRRDLLALLAGTATYYLIGVPWLGRVLEAEPARAVALGLLPFLPGDLLKIAAAALVAPLLRRTARRGSP